MLLFPRLKISILREMDFGMAVGKTISAIPPAVGIAARLPFLGAQWRTRDGLCSQTFLDKPFHNGLALVRTWEHSTGTRLAEDCALACDTTLNPERPALRSVESFRLGARRSATPKVGALPNIGFWDNHICHFASRFSRVLRQSHCAGRIGASPGRLGS